MMTRLDELISENAKPAAILDFIAAAPDVRRLFSESLFFQRVFQLDFFLACDRLDVDRLFKFADFLPARDRTIFAFQIRLSNADKAQYAKYRHRRKLNELSSAFGSFNPYVYLYGETADAVRQIDKVCFKAAVRGDMANLHRDMPEKTFGFFAKHLGFSLFQNRIAQLDVLLSTPPALQTQLVNGVIAGMPPRYYIRFVKSVFASGADMGLKTSLLDGMKASKIMFLSNDGVPYADLVSRYSSFQEMVMKDSISGCGGLNDMFAMYLLLYMPENLKTWLDSAERFPPYLRREDVDGLASYSISHGGSNAACA